ncbi:MAG: hypothetical protein GX247_01430 [Mollicutes bacterium]|nr:hypothetical protein [Mollicutes bacterium]
MKKKSFKIILLGIFCLLLVGCNIDYNVVIDSNNRVKENIIINIPNNILSNDESPKKALDKKIEGYKKIPAYKYYKVSRKVGKNNSILNIKREYSKLEKYADSPILNDLFENIMIIENDYYTVFKTVGDYNYDYFYGRVSEPIDPSKASSIKDVVVKIQLHNKLIESNADEVDEKNNIYTWYFSPEYTAKYIYMKYGKEKRYDIIIKSFIKNNIGIVIVVSTIVIGVLVLGSIFFIKRIGANKI